MGVNDLQFNQLATVLNAINAQATGKASIAPVNTAQFVSVAQTTLKTGYDPVLNAISQVLSRTIFSNRPYSAKFKGLQVSNQRYGAITRKLSTADKPFEEDDRIKLVDGQSVDQYTVNKPNILETHFYGQNVFQKSLTLFRDQLDTAFSGVDQFNEFVSMVMQNSADMIEQCHEQTARATINNFIMGKVKYDTGNCIHLLTEYNTATGETLTYGDLFKPANFKPFMQWVYSHVASLASLLTERSAKYHMNVTHFGGTPASGGGYTGGEDKTIMRHTPYDKQKIYLYAPIQYASEATVLADTFHDNYLKLADKETVNYWQSIETRDQIKGRPACMDESGAFITPSTDVTASKVFGVIFDEDAMGYTVVNQWSAPTPFNAKGGYSNLFYHFTDRYWNDFTENGIVLLLD